MGLLDSIFSTSDQIKKNVKGLLSNPTDYAEQMIGLLTDKAAEQQRATSAAWATRDPKKMAQQALDSSQTALGFAPLGMLAYHGSPHKFDKFSLDKIGTGEGAQAYGHGLYLAEHPETAKTYQADRSYVGKVMSGQQHGETFDASWIAQNALDEAGNTSAATAKLNKVLERNKSLKAKGQEAENEKVRAAVAMLESGRLAPRGNLYKTDIPDEAVARFLDWDKPLSQQAPEVQAALQNTKNKQLRAMTEYANVPYSEAIGGEAKTMGEAFRLLNLNLHGKSSADSAKASALLAKQGIPGIRYLDGGSRSGGSGTSNFVAFDPELIRILERNGIPTGNQPWKAGEWQGLLGGAKEVPQSGGLLSSTWKQNDVFGTGTHIEHIGPNGKDAVIQQVAPSGKVSFYPATVKDGSVNPLNWNAFNSLEEAQSGLTGQKISESLKSRNKSLYGSIPNTWKGEERALAKKVIDEFGGAEFRQSTQSKSKYLILPSGEKIRMSDHSLPLHYEGADHEFRFGSDIADFINQIRGGTE